MKVLIVGDPIVDVYTYCNFNRMSPEDNTIPVLDVYEKKVALGGVLNVACNIKSLNHQNDVFVAAPMSGWTISELIFKNIGNVVEQMFSDVWNPSEEELIKERFINMETHKQIVRIDNKLKFDDDIIKKFKKAFSCIVVDNFDCVVISDYVKGCIDWSVINKLKGIGCPIFVDTKQKNLSMWKDLGNVIVKINEKEFQSSDHSKQIKNLVVTHGQNPVQLRKYDQLVKSFEVRHIEQADIVGCGDVFLAGLVVEYLRSENLEKSIKFAIRAAEKSCYKQGTCTVEEDEMK